MAQQSSARPDRLAALPLLRAAVVPLAARVRHVEEAAEFQKEIESILGYVEELSAVDVEGIEPMAHATAITNVFGKDVPGPQLDREAILGNAPETLDDELIRVPKVIEDGDGGTH